MLEAVTLLLSRDSWASKGEKDFYSPFSQLRNPPRGKKTMRLFSSQTGRNFCLYYLNTCKQPSQGEWLSAGGISLYHNNYHESVGSIMFSALLLRSSYQDDDPTFLLVSIRWVCCLKCNGKRGGVADLICEWLCWKKITVVEAHSHLWSMSRWLPCIFKSLCSRKDIFIHFKAPVLMSLLSVT